MGSLEDEKDDPTDDGGDTEVVLDLSGRKLTKLEKAPSNRAFATALVLDDNCLQNLTNLDSYGELQRISLSNNKVMRMYWFARMYSLRILNLPGNNIVTVEGLKELQHLVHLNLAANSIKTMDGISHCHKLEHLNLSGNAICALSDLTSLPKLKELFLHRNRLMNLNRGNKYLPTSLVIFTLSDNLLADLNDLCHLSHLSNLEQFTILNNPCLQPFQLTDETGRPTGAPLAFDYRPYVINWCLNLKVLDGYKVTPMESLKGEWLYSQGRGRGFQLGEHGPLVQYLSGVCLVGGGWGGAALPETDHKLVKILQLAKQHQQDLRQKEDGEGGHNSLGNAACGAAPASGRGLSVSQHSSPATHRRFTHSRPPPHNRRHTAPTRICPADRRSAARAACQQQHLKLQKLQQQQQEPKYHVELSSTLYGGGLKTPDAPCGGLMTQSMDPSMLLGPLGDGASPNLFGGGAMTASVMTRSLGAEQLQEALVSGLAPSRSQQLVTTNMDPEESGPASLHSGVPLSMTQSLGPEQLAQKLSLPHVNAESRSSDRMALSYHDAWRSEEQSYSLTNGLNDNLTQPGCLYEDENSYRQYGEGAVQLSGSSSFVPAPESVISPEQRSPAGGSHSYRPASAPHRPPINNVSNNIFHQHPQLVQQNYDKQPANHAANVHKQHQQTLKNHSTLLQQQSQHQSMIPQQQPPHNHAMLQHQQQPPPPLPPNHHSMPQQPSPAAPQSLPHHPGMSAHQASHQAADHRQQELSAPKGARSGLQRSGAARGAPPPRSQPTTAMASPKLGNCRARSAGAKGPGLGNESPRLPSARPATSPKPTLRAPRGRGNPPPQSISTSYPQHGPDDCSDSDNTDSEVSVSKLQTIKSIAAERRMTERGRDPTPPRQYGAPSAKDQPGSAAGHEGSHSIYNIRQQSLPYNPDNYRPESAHSADGRGGGSSSRSSSSASRSGATTTHGNVQRSSSKSRPALHDEGKSRGGCSSVSRQTTFSCPDLTEEEAAAVTLQRHWRGYRVRQKHPAAVSVRQEMRQARAEEHIRVLQSKLQRAEEALERERRLRHLQLEAIRALWRQIGRLQTGRTTPASTPSSTPLTPSTPMDALLPKGSLGSKRSSSCRSTDDTVKDLTQFCNQLQGQVVTLQDSLSMVSQVMNAFCQLPASQALLLSQSTSCSPLPSLSSSQNPLGGDDSTTKLDGNAVPTSGQQGTMCVQNSVALTESLSSLTSSITALTSNIVATGSSGSTSACDVVAVSQSEVEAATVNKADNESGDGLDRNSTALDASTTSHDDGADVSELSHGSSAASHSGSHATGRPTTIQSCVGPQRPSSLPVCRDSAQRR
ncbi:uncharacterized protein LOC108683348 isoform X1 [Hyalella azteca]|uniref:Centrosomal protein of 97 kDa n=1 Tax=Hyalella azteca TaxID=294128 RepID=A0A979FFR6_HYAAZ|nr:uncharacterized protein LOC108683348 isoform X1 [Hyalella azteca]